MPYWTNFRGQCLTHNFFRKNFGFLLEVEDESLSRLDSRDFVRVANCSGNNNESSSRTVFPSILLPSGQIEGKGKEFFRRF